MIDAEITGFRALPRLAMGVVFSALLVIGVLAGGAMAQGGVAPAQQQTLAKCLASCRKGDANCQNTCTNKVATPGYFSAAGACIRACADALVVPGQQSQSVTDDLQKCVQACN